jgi:hypothetical protein
LEFADGRLAAAIDPAASDQKAAVKKETSGSQRQRGKKDKEKQGQLL